MTEDTAARRRLQVHPQVLHETIDGEVIVIDLATGTYFSLRDSAADVWAVVNRLPGASSEDVVSALAGHYEDLPADAEASVETFLAELEAEGLVRAFEGASPPPTPPADARNGSAPRVFASPRLEKYTDMQDLVLLDPVHEVDATGWPHNRGDVAGTTS